MVKGKYWECQLSFQKMRYIGEISSRVSHQEAPNGVKLVISDVHEGLKTALGAVFPSIPWSTSGGSVSFATKCAEFFSYSGYKKKGSFKNQGYF